MGPTSRKPRAASRILTPMQVLTADITTLAVDAIVNAANQRMLGGGGVDGAIHRAAGPRLLDACRAVPEVAPHIRCPTGQARITPGFDLPAKYVIHTVGPVYRDGSHGEPDLLADCYRHCLDLAGEHGCQSIAFPAISTGVYGYPKTDAADIAVITCRAWLGQHDAELDITFCCFADEDAAIYQGLLSD